MSDTKTKLQEIKEKASNPNISLLEIKNLLDEWEKIIISLPRDAKEEKTIGDKASEAINAAIFNSIDKWEKGEIEPKEAELGFLAEWCFALDYLEKNWEIFEKSINENKQLDADEKQRTIGPLKKIVEKFKNYKPKLEKLFQKEQENSHQHEKGNEDSNISSEISSEEKSQQSEVKHLNVKISLLQNQVEELKEKLNSADPATRQEIQRKIEKLEELRKNVQAQLDKLQNEVSSRSSSIDPANTDKRKKKGKFPTLGIILIIFAVLVIAGIVGYFILEKKERPNPKKSKNK